MIRPSRDDEVISQEGLLLTLHSEKLVELLGSTRVSVVKTLYRSGEKQFVTYRFVGQRTPFTDRIAKALEQGLHNGSVVKSKLPYFSTP